MYAAYQSHQSCGGATASKAPCRSEVSCSRSASEPTSMSVLPFPAGEPGRDLLELPGIAVRVAERSAREVRASWRVEARGPALLHIADVHAPADEVVPGRVDVRDDEDHPGSRSRLSRGAALPDLDRASRVGRRELHRADVVADDQVDVQPPSEALVEALRPIDLGDGQRHYFEIHVHALSARRPARRFTAYVGAAHLNLHVGGCALSRHPASPGRSAIEYPTESVERRCL